MTNNIYIECDVCGSILDLKWQIGFLPKSEFIISCGKCKSTIKGTLYTDNKNIKLSYDIVNAKEVEPNFKQCDFIIPISGELITEKMRPGSEQFKPTTYINLTTLVGFYNFDIYKKRFLTGIHRIENEKNIYDRFNELYFNKKFDYLKKELKQNLDIKMKRGSIKEILENKYKADINFWTSFTDIVRYRKDKEKVVKNIKKIKGANKHEYEKLLGFFSNNMNKFEKKINETLNLFINNYNSFIPVMLVEYLDKNKKEEIFHKYAITTVDFEDVRELYLRIYENIMEVSGLLIGFNNIIHRGDYAKIDGTIINGKSTIEQYQKMSKGNKLKYTMAWSK